jgi:hypothetical protein
LLAESDSPVCGVPEIVGRLVLASAPEAPMIEVIGETAESRAARLEAPIRTRTVAPTSASARSYSEPVAPSTAAHCAPLALQRSH